MRHFSRHVILTGYCVILISLKEMFCNIYLSIFKTFFVPNYVGLSITVYLGEGKQSSTINAMF